MHSARRSSPFPPLQPFFSVLLSASLCLCGSSSQAAPPQPSDYFAIRVVDEQTGRGVPLVELLTTHNVRYYTDSNGLVAFYEPGLMDQDVWFHVKSHGYEHAKDGFGFAGARLKTIPGTCATLKLKRLNIAERLYRMTGGGVYRDSLLLGLGAAPRAAASRPAESGAESGAAPRPSGSGPTSDVLSHLTIPLDQPALNAQVFGQDSVMNVLYQGKLFWFWGDTGRPAYPLGHFHCSAATSLLPADGGLPPDRGVNLTYFTDDTGFARGVARMGDEGMTWPDAFVVVNEGGRAQMLAVYARLRSLSECFERGFMEWSDADEKFVKIRSFDPNAPVYPGAHPLKVRAAGEDYFYFPRNLPWTRVRATRADFTNLDRCEAWTCLKPGTRLDDAQIDRTPEGRARWTWRTNTPAPGAADLDQLVKAGHLKPDECPLAPRDVDTGKPVLLHGCSVFWNAYRGRWVMIASEIFGTSMLGEAWYLEADTPLGPWVYARKILTHDQYSFYNPKQHPYFAQDGGRVIYFEGTYSEMFSGACRPTPYYDYNNVMYRLDLADPRLVLPVPVYDITAAGKPQRLSTRTKLPADAPAAPPIVFFACDRPRDGLVPVPSIADPGPQSENGPAPAFYALEPDTEPVPPMTVALYAYTTPAGDRYYAVNVPKEDAQRPAREDDQRSEQPIAYVWVNPLGRELTFDLTAEQPAQPNRDW